jgi:hypothetical protein
MGSTAWAEAPNAKPRTVRWAAFDGDVGEKDAAAGRLGRIVYGSDDDGLSVIELRAKPRNDDLALGLSHSAVLTCVDARANPANGRAVGRHCRFSPVEVGDRGHFGSRALRGFKLMLSLDRRKLVEIPVESDRLVVKRARATAPILLNNAPRQVQSGG